MIRRPPRSTRTDTPCTYTTRFRSRHDIDFPKLRGLAALAEGKTYDPDVIALVSMHGDGAAGPPDKVRGMGADHQSRFRSLSHINSPQAYFPATDHRPQGRPRCEPGQKHSPETRSEGHTSELTSLMRTSYAVFCL